MKVTIQTSSGAAQGRSPACCSRGPVGRARAAAQICAGPPAGRVIPCGGFDLQGERQNPPRADSASGNRQNGVLSAEIAESSAGLQKLSPADPPQLQVIFADHQELAGPTGTLAAQTDSVPPANRSASEDAFTNPFEDPSDHSCKTQTAGTHRCSRRRLLSVVPPWTNPPSPTVESMANVGENFEGLSPSPEVKTFRSRSPAGSGNSSQQFQPELRSARLGRASRDCRRPARCRSARTSSVAQKNQPPKPLGDQLAAGPMVSPDICPEPADAERPAAQWAQRLSAS